jgi:hypothetical protein
VRFGVRKLGQKYGPDAAYGRRAFATLRVLARITLYVIADCYKCFWLALLLAIPVAGGARHTRALAG